MAEKYKINNRVSSLITALLSAQFVAFSQELLFASEICWTKIETLLWKRQESRDYNYEMSIFFQGQKSFRDNYFLKFVMGVNLYFMLYSNYLAIFSFFVYVVVTMEISQ